MKAVILAAGKGSRLGELTKGNPKTMLTIGKNSLIGYQIKACRKQGIEKYIIVVGYKQEMLKKHVLSFLPQEKVTFVENKLYETTNTLYSLWLCSSYLDEDFLYFNADVLFHPDILNLITAPTEHSLLLLEKKHCREEEVKIKEKNGIITEIGKLLNPADCSGEFIGVARFIAKDIALFCELLSFGIKNQQANNYFEYAVNLLVKQRELLAVDTLQYPSIEIDFPDDYQQALKTVYPQLESYL